DEEVIIARLERGPVRFQYVAGQLAQVEAGGEQVVLVLRTKGRRFVPNQAASRGGAQVRQHGHQGRPGPGVVVDDVVVLTVDAAIDGVDQPVAATAAGVLDEGRRQDAFAAWREHDMYRVIHAAGQDRLDAGAVRPAAEDMGRAGDERRQAGTLVGL